jgi:tripartite-type tricarboxylate transporter receptor subunit TctC
MNRLDTSMRRRMLKGSAAGLAGSGLSAGAGLTGSLWSATAGAQETWPSKPVRVIVPFPAGGVVDLVARAVTDRLAAVLKQPFVVEAKPGANGNIGTEAAARASADGYTLLTASPATVTQPLLSNTARHKVTDFAGVGIIGAPPNLFVVSPSLPVRTLKELVEYVRNRPGQLSVTNPGVGTSNHLGQELFFSLTGLQMINVRYPGQPQMIPDLASGQVHFGLVTQGLAMPHIREGRLRALAIGAPRRSKDLPDVPTTAEAGFAEATFLPWYGLVAPAGTPRPIIKRLSDETLAALKEPEVMARLDKMGTQITPGSAEDFDALLKSEQDRWSRVIRERNIKAEG